MSHSLKVTKRPKTEICPQKMWCKPRKILGNLFMNVKFSRHIFCVYGNFLHFPDILNIFLIFVDFVNLFESRAIKFPEKIISIIRLQMCTQNDFFYSLSLFGNRILCKQLNFSWELRVAQKNCQS